MAAFFVNYNCICGKFVVPEFAMNNQTFNPFGTKRIAGRNDFFCNFGDFFVGCNEELFQGIFQLFKARAEWTYCAVCPADGNYRHKYFRIGAQV